MNVEDRFEVTDLMTRSVFALDINDMKTFSECHTHDHYLELTVSGYSTTIVEGREQYVNNMTKSEERLKSGIRRKHHLSNIILEEVSDELIWGRHLGIVTVQRGEYVRPEFSHTSTVEYEFSRTVDGWRISKTKLVIDNKL